MLSSENSVQGRKAFLWKLIYHALSASHPNIKYINPRYRICVCSSKIQLESVQHSKAAVSYCFLTLAGNMAGNMGTPFSPNDILTHLNVSGPGPTGVLHSTLTCAHGGGVREGVLGGGWERGHWQNEKASGRRQAETGEMNMQVPAGGSLQTRVM